MSGSARITINGYELISWQDTYNKWYFRNDDEKINILDSGLGVDDKTIFGYRASVDTIRRRLQLDGYDLRSAEKDFYDTKLLWVRDILDTLELDRVETKRLGKFLLPEDLYHINEDYKILKEVDFKTWIEKIPEALKLMKDKKRGDIPNRESWDPLLYFMLSLPCGVHNKNYGFVGALFPSKHMESYAAVLLSLSKDDDKCVLNASGLLSNGWSEFINEQGQTQASETKFYNDFLDSLLELSMLNQESNNPLIQRMIYSNAITSMESYLSETMKRHVLNRHAIKRRFIETHTVFNKNIKESDVFGFMDGLDKRLSEEIDKISFHNIGTARDLYNNVLLCDFPEDKLSDLANCIKVRHDIVHRNGKSTDGFIVSVTQDDVEMVIHLVHKIIEYIDKQIISGLPDDKMNIIK